MSAPNACPPLGPRDGPRAGRALRAKGGACCLAPPLGLRGFTLLEVMVALAILSISLVAIIGINGGAVSAHTYAKQVSVATLLARSKMSDLETQFNREGFTSEFDQTLDGDFSDEGWDNFRWEAEIVKPDLDAANATGMVEQLVEQFTGQADAAAAEARGSSAPVPTTSISSQMAAFTPMIESQVTTLIQTVEQAVREVRLRVLWKDGTREESLEVVTHLVVLAPAGQPGGEPLDPEAAGQLGFQPSTGGQQQLPTTR